MTDGYSKTRKYNKKVDKEVLLNIIEQEVGAAETYIDSEVRPSMMENMEYYHGMLPTPSVNGSSYVEPVVFASVEHMLANCLEAFSGEDLLEITPDDPHDTIAVSVVQEVINDILDRTNNRTDIFEGWFRTALSSKNGIVKAYKDIETTIRTEYFSDLDEVSIDLRKAQLMMSDEDEINVVITEEKMLEIQVQDPLDPTFIFSEQQISFDGYFEYKQDKEVVRIENIKTENFLIDSNATRIKDARFCGHKSATTFSDLLGMGFSKDVLRQAEESINTDVIDVEDNIVSQIRKIAYNSGYSDVDESIDPMEGDVTLYELYIWSSIQNGSSKTSWKKSRLYQVFYIEGAILSCEEVNRQPYVDLCTFGDAHTFWGLSYTDKLKHLQNAQTGIMRGYMENIYNANRPRYTYTKGRVDHQSLMSFRTGACVALKDGGQVGLLQTNGMPTNTDTMLNRLEGVRQNVTGVAYNGNGLIADVIKSGGSTATASMALNQMQMFEKKIIKQFSSRGIKPLIDLIYNILREEFSEYTVKVNNEDLTISPSTDLPSINGIRVRTELGSNAKLEKIMVLTGFRDNAVTMSAQNPEYAKQFGSEQYRNLNKSILDLSGVKLSDSFLKSEADIKQQDQTNLMLQQMQQQIQATQQQIAKLSSENQQLLTLNNDRVMRELSIKESKQRDESIHSADKMTLERDKFNHNVEVDADKQSLEETKLEAEILMNKDL